MSLTAGQQRTRYQERKDAGLCTYCGKEAAVEGIRCPKCTESHREYSLAFARNLRLEVLNHYGAPYCACCNDKFAYEFLHLDHIDGGGNKHRRELSGGKRSQGSPETYRWIKRNGFPSGFQVLCANCNLAKGFYGECPHQRERKEMLTKLAAMPMTY